MKPVSTKLLKKWKSEFESGIKPYPKGLWYRRIERLRRNGIRFLYSREELHEVGKCMADKLYFYKKYVRITTIDGIKNFVPYQYQKDIINATKDHKKVIIESSRQMGKSTIIASDLLYNSQIMQEPCIVLAHNKSVTRRMYERFVEEYVELPFFIKQGLIRLNTRTIEFEAGNKIVFATLDTFPKLYKELQENYEKPIHLYIDDFEFIPSHFMKSIIDVLEQIPERVHTVITGKSSMNTTYLNKLIDNGSRPLNDPDKNKFTVIKAPWYAVETRDDKWKSSTIETLGSYDLWLEEYDIHSRGRTQKMKYLDEIIKKIRSRDESQSS